MQHTVLHPGIGGVYFWPVSLLAVTLQPFLATKIEAVLATIIWPRWWLPGLYKVKGFTQFKQMYSNGSALWHLLAVPAARARPLTSSHLRMPLLVRIVSLPAAFQKGKLGGWGESMMKLDKPTLMEAVWHSDST